jgi:hypothetical protein
MKCIYIILILIFSILAGYTQPSITGYWYSGDSSRVYQVYETSNGFEGALYHSTRKGDSTKAIVLTALQYRKGKKRYYGLIHALRDRSATMVKLKIAADGNTLYLVLPRMIFLPVKLVWRRCSKQVPDNAP